MSEIVLNVLQNVPFAVALLIVFWLLASKIIDSGTKSAAGRDSLDIKLIELMSSLKSSIDALDRDLVSLEATISKRNELLQRQSDILEDINKKVDGLVKTGI